MGRRKKATLPKSELNITSMMDLVLNLLMFFVLVANFSSAELPPLEPPSPHDSKALKVERSNNVAVSLIPAMVERFNPETGSKEKVSAGTVERIKVGSNEEIIPDPSQGHIRMVVQALEKVRQDNESANAKKAERDRTDVTIDVRADKSLPYEQVQPILQAIATAGITKFNVIAVLSDKPAGEKGTGHGP